MDQDLSHEELPGMSKKWQQGDRQGDWQLEPTQGHQGGLWGVHVPSGKAQDPVMGVPGVGEAWLLPRPWTKAWKQKPVGSGGISSWGGFV